MDTKPKAGETRYGYAILTDAEGELCAVKLGSVELIQKRPAYKSQAELAEMTNKKDPYKNVGAVLYLAHTSVRVREDVITCISLLAVDEIEGVGRQ